MPQSETVADASAAAGIDSPPAGDTEPPTADDTAASVGDANATASTDNTDPATDSAASTDSDGATTGSAGTAPDAEGNTDVEGDTEAETEADAPLPLDQVFGILKNQRRRRVLRMLQQADGKVSLSDLAEQIAAWENDKEIKQITSSERKRVYVGLYQCHLPKMDGMGVIEFNKPRGTVELGDNMEIMYKYLETAESGNEPDWHRYSTALSVGGAVALAVAMVVRPMTTLPVIDLSVAGLLVAFSAYGFVCLGWAHTRDDADNPSVNG